MALFVLLRALETTQVEWPTPPPARSEVVTATGSGIVEIELTLPEGAEPLDNVANVGLIARAAAVISSTGRKARRLSQAPPRHAIAITTGISASSRNPSRSSVW